MRDIRKPYRNSRSNSGADIARRQSFSFDEFDSNKRSVSEKAEKFERNEYEDIDFTRDGKPVMRASSHFDLNNGMVKRKRRSEFDVLKREEFFNSKKREFDEDDVKGYRKARNKKKRVKRVFWYSFTILLILIFLALTFVFDKATININPKYRDVAVADTFLIFKDDTLVDIASSTLSKTVLKSEPKEINQKASGEITIYNNYSESSQVLIKNTRFQTADGKVFRIGDSITVPGKSGSTPGSIKVKVSADSYGADYNIGPSDFTIPGFKGTARYEGFYAKSSSPMTGGASGMIQIVSQSDIENANAELKPKVLLEISSSTNKIVHDGYYILYGIPLITFTDNSSTLMTSDKNSYNLTGVASVFSIKKDILAKLIATQVLKDEYNGHDNVRLESIDNLGFSLSEDTDPNTSILKVTITGKVRIIWAYDEVALKNDLSGRKLKDFTEVIKKYNYAILNASSKIDPFWSRSFPDSPNKIKIIEEIK